MKVDLNLKDIQDEIIKENFYRLKRLIEDIHILDGEFTFVTFSVNAAVTNYTYPHRLRFKPTDVIPTSVTGAGTLTWNYNEFDATNLNITTTGAVNVRAFVGRYKES